MIKMKKHYNPLLIVLLTSAISCTDKRHANELVTDEVNKVLEEYNSKLNGGKGKLAVKFLDSAFYSIRDKNDLDFWYYYWNKNQYHLNYDSDIAKASLYTDSLEFSLTKLSDKKVDEYAKSIYARSNVLLAQKKYEEAFKNYFEGRKYAKNKLDLCQISDLTTELAKIKFQQEKYIDAANYYKIALKENQDCTTDTTFQYQFSNVQNKMNAVAITYEFARELDSAIYYYQTAIKFIGSSKHKSYEHRKFAQVAKAVVCGNLGGAYFKKGEYVLSEQLLKQSIAINDREGYDKIDAMSSKAKLANLYLKTQRAKLCYELINEVLADLADVNLKAQDIAIRSRCYIVLKAYFEEVKDYKAAFEIQTKHYKIKDSVTSVKAGLKSANMEMAFELNEERYKSEIIKKESEIKSLYILAFALILVFAVGMLVSFWRNISKSRLNIAQLKKLNAQNQQTLAALEISHSENDKIMRIVAHDLRNPLSGISGVVALMLEEEGFSAESKEELALIKSTSDNSLALVNELLQINSSMEGLEMVPVDMGELVQYCSDLLQIKAQSKNQQIHTQSLHCWVIANREKLWRVLGNLIGNAIKFSPLNSTISVSMTTNDQDIIVAVSDQGIGIPPQMVEKLFEMFTPAKRSGTSGEESFGMGLSISKKIIEGHSGKIWFESQEGKGTTFYFSLPLGNHQSIKL
jgi:signal transduction histidine kinase